MEPDGRDGTVVSVGGTWLGKRQDRMFELCRELGVKVYPQFERGDTVMHLDGANGVTEAIPRSSPLGWSVWGSRSGGSIAW